MQSSWLSYPEESETEQEDEVDSESCSLSPAPTNTGMRDLYRAKETNVKSVDTI